MSNYKFITLIFTTILNYILLDLPNYHIFLNTQRRELFNHYLKVFEDNKIKLNCIFKYILDILRRFFNDLIDADWETNGKEGEWQSYECFWNRSWR